MEVSDSTVSPVRPKLLRRVREIRNSKQQPQLVSPPPSRTPSLQLPTRTGSFNPSDGGTGRSDKGKRRSAADLRPPSQALQSQLSIRTKPLTTSGLPDFPQFFTLLKEEDAVEVLHSYPVSFLGLLNGQVPQFATVLENVSNTSERTSATFTREISTLRRHIEDRDQHVRLLTNKMNRTPTPSPDEMIANAMRDTTIQMIQEEMARLQYDHDRLLYERSILCDDIDTIKTHYAYTLQERDDEMIPLRTEVSRLLDKNMKETLLYNDLLEDHEALQGQLDRTKKRLLLLEDAAAEKKSPLEPVSARRSMRSASAKDSYLAEQQRLQHELLEANKATKEVAEERDELLAVSKAKYRSLRSTHLKLKRKYEQMTEEVPLKTQAATPVALKLEEPSSKKRKTRASGSAKAVATTPAPKPSSSKLNIDLRILALSADGTVSQHVHMQALEPDIMPSEDLTGLKTTAWNLLRTSHSGAAVCDGMSVDDISIMVKVKGFPNGRWETVDDGGLKIWWIAAKGLAAAFEQGLLGEMDVMFVMGEVPGAEWTAARSMRLADAISEGHGFMVLERAQPPSPPAT